MEFLLRTVFHHGLLSFMAIRYYLFVFFCKILKYAEEVGYHPNPIARKLTQQRTYNIGVVVPEFLNPFFPGVFMGIQDVLLKRGYQVLIMQSNENDITERENLQTLVDNFVDGIILSLSQESKNINYLQNLIEK